MRNIIATILFSGIYLCSFAQEASTNNSEMEGTQRTDYIRQASEVTGKHTVFTEIVINASPEVVRSKFLEFGKWPEWNPVIPEIAVITGDIDDLMTKPTIELMLDFGRKKDPAKAPVFPDVTENSAEVFNWGFDKGMLLRAEHVFIFESINNGNGTRLVHYEKMAGMISSFTMTKKVKANMTERYELMNEALKNLCEESL